MLPNTLRCAKTIWVLTTLIISTCFGFYRNSCWSHCSPEYWRTRNTDDFENISFCWSCLHEYPLLYTYTVDFLCLVHFTDLVCFRKLVKIPLKSTGIVGLIVKKVKIIVILLVILFHNFKIITLARNFLIIFSKFLQNGRLCFQA